MKVLVIMTSTTVSAPAMTSTISGSMSESHASEPVNGKLFNIVITRVSGFTRSSVPSPKSSMLMMTSVPVG